jgi:uncharacterized membrane protein
VTFKEILGTKHALIAATAVAAGTSTIFRRLALREYEPFQFEAVSSLLHFFLGYIVVKTYTFFTKPVWNIDPTRWTISGFFWIVLHSMMSLIAGLAFMYALRNDNDAGYVSAMTSITPIVTLLISVSFLGEQMTTRGCLGIALVILGSYISVSK